SPLSSRVQKFSFRLSQRVKKLLISIPVPSCKGTARRALTSFSAAITPIFLLSPPPLPTSSRFVIAQNGFFSHSAARPLQCRGYHSAAYQSAGRRAGGVRGRRPRAGSRAFHTGGWRADCS